MSERRYELAILVGLCSQAVAEELLMVLADHDGVRALGESGQTPVLMRGLKGILRPSPDCVWVVFRYFFEDFDVLEAYTDEADARSRAQELESGDRGIHYGYDVVQIPLNGRNPVTEDAEKGRRT